jgi:hypothetical protein
LDSGFSEKVGLCGYMLFLQTGRTFRRKLVKLRAVDLKEKPVWKTLTSRRTAV